MNFKKVVSVISALCMMCAVIPVLPAQNTHSLTVQAYEIGEDNLGYDLKTNSETGENYAVVLGTKEKRAEIIIPEIFTASDGSLYLVTEIQGAGFLNSGAFWNDDVLERVVIGKNVKTIGQEAFENDTALKEIQFSEGLETIEPWGFSKCTALESVTLPASLKLIEGQAFRQNDNLKTVEFLGGNDLVIGSYAFYGDKVLETLVMGEGVSEIKDAFSYCEALSNVQLSPTLKTIGTNAFSYCTALTEIEIPASVETIGESAFHMDSNLKTIKLNEGLKTIARTAFWLTGVEELTIPSTVESIGNQAFECRNLKTITFLGKETPIGGSIPKTAVIRGYEGSTAQEYAEKNGYTFELIDSAPETSETETESQSGEMMLGDADNNQKIDILDVITLNKAVMGKETLSENSLKAIDFNQNGKPDSEEALTILKYIVGLVTELT